MENILAQRLEIYDADPAVPAGVTDFVRAELAQIDPNQCLTDDTAGIFVSHLIMAIARLVTGNPVPEEMDAETYAEVLVEQPNARMRADALANRIVDQFGVHPPESELQYLTVHLALLANNLQATNNKFKEIR